MGTIQSSFALAGLGGIALGFLLASQLGPWVWALVGAPTREVKKAFQAQALSLVLRLVVLCTVFWLIWRGHAAWRPSFFGGTLIGAMLFLAQFTWLMARRRPDPEPLLTIEALERKRRLFVVSSTLCFAIVVPTVIAFMHWSSDTWRDIYVFIYVLLAPVGGYIWAVFMWQWLRASLISADNARRKATPDAPPSPFTIRPKERRQATQ